jgi:hypothetical protein
MGRRKHGRLLLSVPIKKVVGERSKAWFGWLYLALGLLYLLDAGRHRPHGADLVLPIVIGALWITGGVGWLWRSSHLRFYENGVLKPLSTDKQSPFLEWRQIERYYWEGNTVFLAAGESLADGFQIRPDYRAGVENLLAAHANAAKSAAT